MLGQQGSFLPGMIIKGKYTLKERIAETEQANVFRAETQTKESVAVKTYNITKLKQDPNYEYLVSCFKKEVELTKNLRNPHIVRYRDHEIDSTKAVLVHEFCDGGDLAKLLKKRGKPFSEEETMLILYYLLKAMTEISRSKIVHRDIKPENIFLQSRDGNTKLHANPDELLKHFTVKIGDFGIAREHSHDIRSFVGTHITMAPEVVLANNYGPACDVWSLGVTSFILQTGRDPWFRFNYLEGSSAMFDKVQDGKPNLHKKSGNDLPFGWDKFPTMNFENKISPRMKEIYRSMIHPDPTKRPTWDQIQKKLDVQSILDKLALETCYYTMRFSSADHSLLVSQKVPEPAPSKNTGAEYYEHMENLTNWMCFTGMGLAALHDSTSTVYTAAFEVLSAIIFKIAEVLMEKLVDKSANQGEATAVQTGFGDFYAADQGKTFQRLLDTQATYKMQMRDQIHRAYTSVCKFWKNHQKVDLLLTKSPDLGKLATAGMAFGRVASQMVLQGIDAGLLEWDVLAQTRQKLFDAFVCLKYDMEFRFRDAYKQVFDWKKFYENQPTQAEFDQMFELVYEFFETKHADQDPELMAERFYE